MDARSIILVLQFSAILGITLAGSALSIWVLIQKLKHAMAQRDEYRVLYEVSLTPLGHLKLAQHFFARSNFWSSISQNPTDLERGGYKLTALEHYKKARGVDPLLVGQFLDDLDEGDRQLIASEVDDPFARLQAVM